MYANTVYNNTLNASPPSATRATQNANLGLRPLVAFCSATFFCARKNAVRFSSSGAKKKSFTAGTLSDQKCGKIQIRYIWNK